MDYKYTAEESVNFMRDYISSHYKDIENACKKISKSNYYQDLTQETILSVLSNKRIPDDIIDKEKYFVYIYVIIAKIYFRKNYKGVNLFQNMFRINSLLLDHKDISTESTELDDSENSIKEMVYEAVFDFLTSQIASKELTDYEVKSFLLYYYPERGKNYVKLNKTKQKDLEKKTSYRKIQKLTGINYQSLRLTNIKVLEKIKSHFEFDDLDILLSPGDEYYL